MPSAAGAGAKPSSTEGGLPTDTQPPLRWGWLLVVAAVGLVPLSLVKQPFWTVAGPLVMAILIWTLKVERVLIAFIALSPFEDYLADSVGPLAIKGAGLLLAIAWLIRVCRHRPRPPQPAHGILFLFLVLNDLLAPTVISLVEKFIATR